MSSETVPSSAIIYTLTDEAPLLATYSFLPIVQAYAAQAGVPVETRDISLAGRIIAAFADRLPEDQRIGDALAELGALAKRPEANIIKLPNVSASIPQLKAAVAELQAQGYELPAYPDEPKTDDERDARARYDKIKGSAVNPVLREGNSDRRAPESVKQYARKHPHSMGAWTADSRTNVATMADGDFRHSEQSAVMEADDTLRIEHVAEDGTVTVLKESVPVLAGEVVDATRMDVEALREFVTEQIARAQADEVLFSVHLKATMMKVSDPIIFGHVVEMFFPDVFQQYGAQLRAAGISPNDGLGALMGAADALPDGEAIREAVKQRLAQGPALAMVDSDKGITNLHVPSDVIVDASMPAMIRTSGHMWGPGRPGGRHPRGDPRLVVRRHLPGGHRRLPRARRLRPVDDGLGAQRRADGAGGRGVRLPRQDLRDPRARHGPRGQRGGRRGARARGQRRRHLARLPDQGRADPQLGRARRDPGPGDRRPCRVLARRDPRPRRQPDRQGARRTSSTRHGGTPTASTSASSRRSRPPSCRSSGSARA